MISTILTFFVIITLEIVLSLDNAAVLALIVNKLPPDQRSKALTYGIWGAYVFRGLSILFVGFLLQNPDVGAYFKLFGGAYLAWLAYSHFTPKPDSIEEGNTSFLDNVLNKLGLPFFWVVVIEVEVLDLLFSMDNILACVAMSKSMVVIILAVFCAIAAMRFVTKYMSVLMEKYPYLENRAYIVIGLIAIKLGIGGLATIFGIHVLESFLENHWTDMVFSLCTMLTFLPFGVGKNEYVNPNTELND